MRLTFLGAGGVGGYFGGLVAASGGDVTLVARGAHGRALRERGLTILSGEERISSRPEVVLPGEPLGDPGALVVAVKFRDLPEALEGVAPSIPGGTPVLSLLNGLGHEVEIRRRLPRARCLLGMAFVGAHVEAPGVIRHTSEGRLSFGELDGPPVDSTRALADALAVGGFPVHLVDDVQEAVWRKLLWNTAFNSANALLGGTCRDLMESPTMVEHLRGVMREVQAVAAAEGVELTDAWVEKSMGADVNFSPYRTSMQLDLTAGRPLEVEPIFSRVIARARARGMAVPRLETLEAMLHVADGLRRSDGAPAAR